MFFADALMALLVAFLLAGVFVPFLGWRPRGNADVASGVAFFAFFGLLFLMTWAGGVWLASLGPTFYGVAWLNFLVVGLFVALLIAALTPATPRSPEVDSAVPRAPDGRTVKLTGVGALSLLLVLILVIAVGAAYV